MPAYSQFSLPTSLVVGDKIDVPLSIVNNHKIGKNIQVKIKEYVFSPKYRVVSEYTEDVRLGPKQSKIVTFKLDTSNQDHNSQDKI